MTVINRKRITIGAAAALVIAIQSISALDREIPTDRTAFPFGATPQGITDGASERFDRLDGPWDQPLELPTASELQQQIDAYGDESAPWAEKIEYVFADGELDIVWVLTDPSAVEAVKTSLADQGIVPSHSISGADDFYLDRGFAIRYEPVEFLYFSERIAPFFEQWLESMQ